MFIAYCVLAVIYSGMLIVSAVGKLRLDPGAVQMIHGTIGVPLALFPVLAACELAAAAGLLAGIRWPRLAMAGAVGAMLYFAGAIGSHLLVSDVGGIGPAVFLLVLASVLLLLRRRTLRRYRPNR